VNFLLHLNKKLFDKAILKKTEKYIFFGKNLGGKWHIAITVDMYKSQCKE